MPELKSTYLGELRIEVTGSYMLGGSPGASRCRRAPGAAIYDVFEIL